MRVAPCLQVHYVKISTTRTPCIGVCSTTSVGDAICRGCKRYAFEVIRWNSYSDVEKESVLRRIEALAIQIMQDKLTIHSVDLLQRGMESMKLPLNPSLSPYCWLHNLLQKTPLERLVLADFGVSVAPAYQYLSTAALADLIDEELLLLCDAHFARYFSQMNSFA